MALEIERKFLVKGEFRDLAFMEARITQGYLSSDPARTIRVRIKDDRGFITVKGAGNDSGTSRFEWEKEIDAGDARAMLAIAEPGVIDKTRYFIRNEDGIHTWEVDVFHGDNEGLIIAEIELETEQDSFAKPDWLGEEVTGNPMYYNSAISKNPYRNWKEQF